MILSIAHAPVEDPDAEYIFGAWSEIAVGDRPEGLVDCYLSRGDDDVYMVSVWESMEAHQNALEDKASHPNQRGRLGAGAHGLRARSDASDLRRGRTPRAQVGGRCLFGVKPTLGGVDP